MPFCDVVNDQAFLKMGILGLQGSGKTYTAAKVAIGLRNRLIERGLANTGTPIYMCDTEVGSSWLASMFRKEGVPFKADKTRAFRDLLDDVDMVAQEQGILVIDSITHFWTELMEAYKAKHKRKRLTFNDIGIVKSVWARFTDLYVNSTAHIIMCGRQGYEYDFFEDDDGKKQLEKTAVKMKAEGETGYEPSLLVLMERHQELSGGGSVEKVWRTAYVLKDRSTTIDGKSFDDPTFEDFLPHIESINLGGTHVGVDTNRTSEGIIKRDESFRYEGEQKEILLDEIKELIHKKYPGMSTDDKQDRGDILEKFFNTRSWKRVESFDLQTLRAAYNELHLELEGKYAYEPSKLEEDVAGLFGK
jgi:hypothetical protein